MEYAILRDYEQVARYVDQVRVIADSNKKSFGFLSAQVYEQMATKGQLWVAVDSCGELVGYLMFGGCMPTLRIFQVYSSGSGKTKGTGIGAALISALKDFGKARSYHTISAKVASDLPANYFWEKMGFSICRQVKGGETTKRIINIRAYSLEGNDLFGGVFFDNEELRPSGPVLNKPVFALDLNLLLDVLKARKGYEKVLKIMRIGFLDGFKVCITPEFIKELERNTSKFDDDPLIRLAMAFPVLKVQDDICGISKKIRDIVFPQRKVDGKYAENDESDLRHLSHCIAAGIGGFITREKALLRSCDSIRKIFGVAILSPDELVFDEGELLDIDRPLSSDFLLSSVSASSETKSFLEGFSAPSELMEMVFSSSPASDESTVHEARLDGELFGVYFFQKPSKAQRNALVCLYLDESCPKAIAAIDHFIEKSLRYRSGFTYRLDVFVGKEQVLTRETLVKKGFMRVGDGYLKLIFDVFVDNKTWNRLVEEVRLLCDLILPSRMPTKQELVNTGVCLADSKGKINVLSWFDFETLISPRFILNSDRKCILVPIRENYANGLMGNVKNQLSLLSSYEKTLLLEKAYFRSTAKASMFKRGGIVAFYVSGRDSIQEIIGFARITYSELVSFDKACVKLDRQGVLSVDELSGISDKSGKIHVFTFDNFLEFENRISFAKAKIFALISDSNLVSPEELGPDKLRVLIGEAFNA